MTVVAKQRSAMTMAVKKIKRNYSLCSSGRERERETHGPIVIHKEEEGGGGGGENFIVTAQPRPNQLTFRELVILLITKIFSREFVKLIAICKELLNVHLHASNIIRQL